jgi:hypothetical protein
MPQKKLRQGCPGYPPIKPPQPMQKVPLKP